MTFGAFFESAMNCRPRRYQARLAETDWPETLVVPTGFGKTAAVLAAWLWKMKAGDAGTPRRLVYCLPMRTLVEQTEDVARKWIAAAARELGLAVHLDVLVGGRPPEGRRTPDWVRQPEVPSILVGTQDLLVSAALMRGYAASRYRWPVDFALLHNDALWVFDEVQLTGATLATSAQLEEFRRQFGTARRSRTLWMSATLDPAWLATVDFTPADRYRAHDLPAEDIERAGHLWNARKPLTRLAIGEHDFSKKKNVPTSYAAALAEAATRHARPGANTILFVNTVARAQALFGALEAGSSGFDLLLVHSRFRAAERKARTERLSEKPPASGRIIVATQALEAGVDVTSAVMMTEVAPWSSLVQRFGRCNRYGECGEAGAEVFWIDLPDDAAAPYEEHELREACARLAGLAACGPAELAGMPPSAPARGQVIRRRDLLDLFDTDPDLSGFDVDVSIYVRDAQDTDVRLFWRPVADGAPPPTAPSPERDELCPAPIAGARELVKRGAGRAWRWDALAKQWRPVRPEELFPGLVLWIDAAVGGYDRTRGFDPTSKEPVVPVGGGDAAAETPEGIGDDLDCDSGRAVSLARHTDHVCAEAAALADALGLSDEERALLLETAPWHDWGKAHDAFVALTAATRTERNIEVFLAKWPRPGKGAKLPDGARLYFRHELASALGFLAASGWREDASLAAYVVAAHHGKVRMRLRALPGETPAPDGRLFARGVHDGERLPAVRLGATDLPETVVDLDIMQIGDSERCGASWSARAQRLLREHGPFRLAWLEALLRIADWRASAAEGRLDHDDL